MTIGFYFDEHMPRVVAEQLIDRKIMAVMAVDVETTAKDDDTEHLPFATKQNLVMVTFDHPFAGRTRSRTDHAGLICLAHSMRNDIGCILRTLTQFAEQYAYEDTVGQVFWLK